MAISPVKFTRPLTSSQQIVYESFITAGARISRDFGIQTKIRGSDIERLDRQMADLDPNRREMEDFIYGATRHKIDLLSKSVAPSERQVQLREAALKSARDIVNHEGFVFEPPEIVFIPKSAFSDRLLGLYLSFVNKAAIPSEGLDDRTTVQSIIHESLHGTSFGLPGPLDEGATEFLAVVGMDGFGRVNPGVLEIPDNPQDLARKEYQAEYGTFVLFLMKGCFEQMNKAYFTGDDTDLSNALGSGTWNDIRELSFKYCLENRPGDLDYFEAVMSLLKIDN
jgi:hypothetical protein